MVDRDTEDYLCSCGLACTEDIAIEMGTLSLCSSARPTFNTFPMYIENPVLSPKKPHPSLFQVPHAESLTQAMKQDKVKRSSVESRTTTDHEVIEEAQFLFRRPHDQNPLESCHGLCCASFI